MLQPTDTSVSLNLQQLFDDFLSVPKVDIQCKNKALITIFGWLSQFTAVAQNLVAR